MDWENVSTELRKPLDPAAIKPPPQGKYGEYVDGLHVIREANRIFGHNGWSYCITRLDQVSRVEASGGQIRVGYLCTVRVDVDGVTREGAAMGSGFDKPDNEQNAHESAIKEAETDALKRALRSFGNTFGLALYDKDKSNREVAKPKKTPEEKRDWVLGNIAKAKQASEIKEWWQKIATVLDALPEPMRLQCQAKYNEAFDALSQKEAA